MNKSKTIFNLESYKDKMLSIKFNRGRKIKGLLKSYDALQNLILEDVIEEVGQNFKRELGLVFVKGASIECLFPVVE